MKTAEGATMDKELESPYLAISKLDNNNQEDIPFPSVETNDRADLKPESADFQMGDRCWRKGVDLIDAVARDAIVFHKTLANSQRAEEFAKGFFISSREVHFQMERKRMRTKQDSFPLPFLTRNSLKKDLTYKKRRK